MPKRKQRKPPARGASLLVLLLVAAIVGGWWVLHPRHASRPQRRSIAELTAPPASTAPSTPTPMPATPAPSASASPAPSTTAHASPSPPPVRARTNGKGPEIALIVDDCGQWIDTERGFIALGVPLTLSVLPDVRYTAQIAKEAAGSGKGVMLHLPMETLSGLNPGPGKVTTEMTDEAIAAQVEADLAQVPMATGVNNHEGSKASADERVMHDVMKVLAKHGNLFFIDSRTNAASVGEQVAQQQGVPTASRDVFLDNTASVDYTVEALRHAAEIAQRTGSAIAIGHPRPTTLTAVKMMIPQLEAAGVRFVLAGDLVSR